MLSKSSPRESKSLTTIKSIISSIVLGFEYHAGIGGTINAPALANRYIFSICIKFNVDSLVEIIKGLFSFK